MAWSTAEATVVSSIPPLFRVDEATGLSANMVQTGAYPKPSVTKRSGPVTQPQTKKLS